MPVPEGWIRPDWPAPANVHAVCTTRAGGASAAPFDSLNLGNHVGDDAVTVAVNRRIFQDAIEARPVFLNQVHGRHSVVLAADMADGNQADACIVTAPRLACTIMVADCLPVLLTSMDGGVVAAAHAGWRGLAGEGGQGILESVCAGIERDTGVRGEHLMAWLGPCIGPEAFEVGPEVKAAFEALDPQAAALFQPHAPGKWLADLPGLARRRLQARGIRQIHGNDGSAAWCTVANPSRFFSHRRDRVSGRFAAAIWRD